MKRLIAIIPILIGTITPVVAENPPESSPAAKLTEINFMEIFDKGGIMMYPLALLSVAAMVLVLLYLMTIRRNAVVSDRFMENAESMIRKRDFLGLLSYSHRRNQCMARITEKSLDFMTKNSSASFSEVREIAESEGSRQSGMLGSRITYLADIGSIAPMVGLLGTVLGMIQSFLHISQGGWEGVKQMELASGVSEALITTATGLAIGIPALVFYSLFRGRVQRYISELEAATTHLMAMLHAQIQRKHPATQKDTASSDDDFALSSGLLDDDRPDLQGI